MTTPYFDPSHSYTFGQLLEPAMSIKDQAEADAYFQALVDYHQAYHDQSAEDAARSVRGNLGYYAGYFGGETQQRVLRLFKANHPILPIGATPEEAMEAGRKQGEKEAEKSS